MGKAGLGECGTKQLSLIATEEKRPDQPVRFSLFWGFEFSGSNRWISARLASVYSYRRLSTGSSLAARAAGTVPNRIPTSDDTTIATIADRPEMGMRYSVKKRTE